jgi:VanZ family protein
LNHGHLRFSRLWVVLGWAWVLAVVCASLTPSPVELHIEQGDKYLHVVAYLVIASWFANLYQSTGERVVCATGCLALGVGLEFVQLLTEVRTFELVDMVANTTGVLIGMFAAPPRLPNYLRLAERLIVFARGRNPQTATTGESAATSPASALRKGGNPPLL